MFSEIYEVSWSAEVQLQEALLTIAALINDSKYKMHDLVFIFDIICPQFTLCLLLGPAGHFK